MMVFANVDGKLLVVDIEDNGEIIRIDDYAKNINRIFSLTVKSLDLFPCILYQ